VTCYPATPYVTFYEPTLDRWGSGIRAAAEFIGSCGICCIASSATSVGRHMAFCTQTRIMRRAALSLVPNDKAASFCRQNCKEGSFYVARMQDVWAAWLPATEVWSPASNSGAWRNTADSSSVGSAGKMPPSALGMSLGDRQMGAVHSESCAQGGINDSASVVLDLGRGTSRLATARCMVACMRDNGEVSRGRHTMR
jgi:hypothetical protein